MTDDAGVAKRSRNTHARVGARRLPLACGVTPTRSPIGGRLGDESRAPSAPSSPPTGRRDFARDLVRNVERIGKIEAVLARTEAALLAYLTAENRMVTLGCTSMAHLASDLLHMGRRTALERVSLHRILVACPEAENAFLETRLSACQVLALGPVIKREGCDARAWIDQSEGLTVREIRRRVREALKESNECSAEEEPEGAYFSFSAPLPFLPAWRETMDLARRVLGHDAPQYRCIEAILAETGDSGCGEGGSGETDTGGAGSIPSIVRPEAAAGRSREMRDSVDRIADRARDEQGPRPGGRSAGPAEAPARPVRSSRKGEAVHDSPGPSPLSDAIRPTPRAVAFAQETLKILHVHMQDIDLLLETGPPSDPFDALDRLEQLQALRAPLRVLLARLVRSIRETGALFVLGYLHPKQFAEEHLKLSERTARSLVQESYLFEDNPMLEQAYGRGEIGLGQAFLVHRLANHGQTAAFLKRAMQVTHTQLQSEYRFHRLLRMADSLLAARHCGPLPNPQLEEGLIRALCRSAGWSREKIAREFEARGLSVLWEDGSGLDPGIARLCLADPAANPVLMRRLELLLDFLVMTRWDDATPVPELLPVEVRQVSAQLDDRIQIRFWAPRATIEDLRAAIERIRRRHGPATPIWIAFVALFAAAEAQWNRQDPETRPTQEKILRRDDHQCQSPLCGRRCKLEAHHIEYVSQGGCDAPWNKTTLCHPDHQHAIHAGTVRLRGRAPYALLWEIGCRPGREPLLVMIGNRILSRKGVKL